jgi:hypothetical protein
VADTFILTVNIGSDAFTPEPFSELRRILLEVADKLEEDRTEGTLRDANGNTVGLFGFEPEGGRG